MTEFGWKTKKLLMKNKPVQLKIAPDFSLRHRKKKLQRKVYCKTAHGYAIDIMVIKPGEFYYLLIQNINTRYLYAFPLYDKTKASIFPIIQQFQEDFEMKSLVGDAERAWDNNEVRDWLEGEGVKVSFKHSDYLHHVPILDSTIKTLRMGANYDVDFMMDEDAFESLVYMFNNAINRNTKITPTEMELYPELEDTWIRHCKRHNDKIERQYDLRYEKGNILLVHFDESKNSKRFEKISRRRIFNELCEFRGYKGMNLAVRRLNEPEPEETEDRRRNSHKHTYFIPYYCAVWIARNIDAIPREYQSLLPDAVKSRMFL